MTQVADDAALRHAQVRLTRTRIAEAVLAVLGADGAVAVTFPAVAKQAGVSLRTVYRHFPNKEALLAAAASLGSETTLAAYPRGERQIGTIRDLLGRLWGELHSRPDLLRVWLTTPAGIEMRADRLRDRVDEVDGILAAELPDLDRSERRVVATMVAVLIGSAVLTDLTDHAGLSLEDAVRAAAATVEALVDRASQPGGIQ